MDMDRTDQSQLQAAEQTVPASTKKRTGPVTLNRDTMERDTKCSQFCKAPRFRKRCVPLAGMMLEEVPRTALFWWNDLGQVLVVVA